MIRLTTALLALAGAIPAQAQLDPIAAPADTAPSHVEIEAAILALDPLRIPVNATTAPPDNLAFRNISEPGTTT